MSELAGARWSRRLAGTDRTRVLGEVQPPAEGQVTAGTDEQDEVDFELLVGIVDDVDVEKLGIRSRHKIVGIGPVGPIAGLAIEGAQVALEAIGGAGDVAGHSVGLEREKAIRDQDVSSAVDQQQQGRQAQGHQVGDPARDGPAGIAQRAQVGQVQRQAPFSVASPADGRGRADDGGLRGRPAFRWAPIAASNGFEFTGTYGRGSLRGTYG